MADYLPRYNPGEVITLTASADITGGRLVAVTGDNTVGPAAAGSAAVVGVAGFDAKSGDHVTIYRDGVQRLTAAGAIAAGAKVVAAAGGQIATAGEGTEIIGLALQTATEGDVIDVAI